MAAPNSTATTINLGGGTPVVMGTTATDKIGFYNTAPVVQPTSSAQAVITLTTVLSSGFGFQTSAGANAFIAQVQAIAACLTANGMWKGS